MKKQRGSGLVEMLVVLGIVLLLTAFVGQSLQSVVQASNEKNISSALLAFQTAEASYVGSYGSYASPITALSACPAAGMKPTSSLACLLPSAYTVPSAEVYRYSLAVSTPPDAAACTTAPCGFLVVAAPLNAASGRFTYCADPDGVLHGAIHQTAAITTEAECGALPIISAGQPSMASTSALPTVYQNAAGASGVSAQAVTVSGIPPGTYLVMTSVAVNSLTSSVTCTDPGVGFSAPGTAALSGTGSSGILGSGEITYTLSITSGSFTMTCDSPGGNLASTGGYVMIVDLYPISPTVPN